MNNIDTYKYIKKINKKNKHIKENKFMLYVKNISERLLLSILVFLIMAISIKKIDGAKEFITKNIYTDNISLAKIKSLYDKYLGGIIPFDTNNNSQMVFKDTLSYKSKINYLDGVELTVDNKYLVPVIKSGLVVFIGSKENYNNVIIIQGEDGIDIWYGNMETSSVKLYDYIEAGSLLGEVKDDKLYLVYSKNGEILNYEDYL